MKSPRNSVRKKTENKIETMGKKRKKTNTPRGRDIARSFLEAIIEKGKEFERMKQVEKRTRADE